MIARRRYWNIAEALAWLIGVTSLLFCTVAYVDGARGTQRALRTFASLQGAAAPTPETTDFSLWSPARIAAWKTLLNEPGPEPLAILRIRRLRIEAPILAGTDEVTLNRAIGHIEDTAIPGSDGNSGIAGHRDSFFRGLKDIADGDEIELETLHAKEIYRVERTWIVDPEDVSVLDPTSTRSLTLVTCYPFYYVGSAPKRFIVRATRVESTP